MKLGHYQKQHIRCQKTQTLDRLTNTLSEASAFDWATDIQNVLKLTEEAERGLSYLSVCGSEHARKQAGSYYTPIDVASFFWNEFFTIHEIDTHQGAIDFISNHRFVEPSAGAGALVFALFNKLASLGVTPQELAVVDIHIIDINKQALSFIQSQFEYLSSRFDIQFSLASLIHGDFRDHRFSKTERPYVFFGNPPFVNNAKGTSSWKNIYADFVDISLNLAGMSGSLQYILPLSIAFSRDYSRLRDKLLDEPREIYLSHFDNIPDTLFKAGKPEHTNTNKANSQRCSILTVRASEKTRVFSTPLHRWVKKDRAHLLSRAPTYHDVTAYKFNSQIPRPETKDILAYLLQENPAYRLGDLISETGKHVLYVGSVARNYIGIREFGATGTHELKFANMEDFHKVLLVLCSDTFYTYWRTIGDGFHVTKSNIMCFPVSCDLNNALTKRIPVMRKAWVDRDTVRKSKLNSGCHTHSYDFSRAIPSLSSILNQSIGT